MRRRRAFLAPYSVVFSLAVHFQDAIFAAAASSRARELGTHAFRRSFAGRLRDVPFSELKELGGKTEKAVIGTYIQPDQDAQRAPLTACECAKY